MPINPSSKQTDKACFNLVCQFVLPLVYDDSLSYYEAMCKLKTKINEVITNNNNIQSDLQNLYDYVNHYFDDLDVMQEINDTFDKLVSDGTFKNMINQDIFGELNKKVDANTNNISTLQKTVSQHTTDISSLENTVGEHTTDISNLENTVSRHTTNISDVEESVSSLESSLGKTESGLNSLRNIVNKSGFSGSCIILADSYGGVRNGVTKSFLALLEQNLSSLGYTVTTKYVDGGGMSSSGEKNFTNLLKSIKEPASVDFILVCGGVNDANRNYNTNSNAVQTFVKYATTRCNQLFLCFCSWVYAYGLWSNGAEAFRAWSECSIFSNKTYFLNGLQVMMRYGNFLSDLNHPTQTGNNYLYANILELLRNKNNTYVSPWFDVTLSPSSITSNISGTFSQKMVNNTVCIRWPLITFNGSYNNFYNSGANYEINLASYTPGIIMPTNSSTFIICQPGVYTTSSGQKNCTVMLYFTPEGKLNCGVHSVDAQGNENASQIIVFPGQITYNNLMY